MTSLLISVRSVEEAKIAVSRSAAWIDLKEPMQGAMGRASEQAISDFFGLTFPDNILTSVAGGELSEWTSELQNQILPLIPNNTFLKVALANQINSPWFDIARALSQRLASPSQLILVHYADAAAQAPGWSEIVAGACSLGCRYVLIDTFNKGRTTLLESLPRETLHTMISAARLMGLQVAIAGSIALNEIPQLMTLGARWIGLRGALCKRNSRVEELCPDRIQDALSLISQGEELQHYVVG
jgi:(5-formylfuran-3-yl)methyl phosphate synthase